MLDFFDNAMTLSRHSGDTDGLPFKESRKSFSKMNNHDCNGHHPALIELKQIADVRFPTQWAEFRLLAFEGTRLGCESERKQSETALALVLGDIHSSPP